MAIADINQAPDGWWILSVSVVPHRGPVMSDSFRFRGRGWHPFGNDHPGQEDEFDILTGAIRMTPDGWAAIEVNAVNGGLGVIVLDVLGERPASPVIQGRSPIWLPEGTLLLSGGNPTANPHDQGVRRVMDHGFGQILDSVVRSGQAFASYPLNYIVHGDLSGLHGSADLDGDEEWDSVTIRWDGTLVPLKHKDPPYLALGVERSAGAGGERIIGCEGWTEACPLKWRRRDGQVLSLPGRAGEVVWTRDGTAVVVLDYGSGTEQRDSSLLIVRDTADGLLASPLGPVAPGELDGGLFFFRGMSDWAAALERDSDRHVNVIPLDGSPVIGPLSGTVALVNP